MLHWVIFILFVLECVELKISAFLGVTQASIFMQRDLLLKGLAGSIQSKHIV